jgi:hypothetical protein
MAEFLGVFAVTLNALRSLHDGEGERSRRFVKPRCPRPKAAVRAGSWEKYVSWRYSCRSSSFIFAALEPSLIDAYQLGCEFRWKNAPEYAEPRGASLGSGANCDSNARTAWSPCEKLKKEAQRWKTH